VEANEMAGEKGLTPAVRALAKRYGVDAASLPGTGVGGRVTTGDVRAAARKAGSPALLAEEARPAPVQRTAGTANRPCRTGESVVDWAVATGRVTAAYAAHWRRELATGQARVTDLERLAPDEKVAAANAADLARRGPVVDMRAVAAPAAGAAAWGRNPLVAGARDRNPRAAMAASEKRPAPTLFAAGDLPPFTASGIDPKVLLQVPWQARHPVAAAPTTASAYQLVQDYSGPDAEMAAAVDHSGHPANVDYEARVHSWLVEGMSGDQLYASLFGG